MLKFLDVFLTPGGMFVLGVLDSSVFFFAPLANDAVQVIMTARQPERWWMYPLIAAAGSLVGTASTLWIGEKIGEKGLERFIPARRLERLREKVRDTGAVALALPAVIPPPFPFTPLVLTCGALKVSRAHFFAAVSAMRLLRYGSEAGLALLYGRRLLVWLESDIFQRVIVAFVIVAFVGTGYTLVRFYRSTRRR